jgi:hypothetical protein
MGSCPCVTDERLRTFARDVCVTAACGAAGVVVVVVVVVVAVAAAVAADTGAALSESARASGCSPLTEGWREGTGGAPGVCSYTTDTGRDCPPTMELRAEGAREFLLLCLSSRMA